MPRERISVVVPLKNEEGSVEKLVDDLFRLPLPGLEMIAVFDDGTTDGTPRLLRKLAGIYPLVSLDLKDKGGLARSYRAGWELALEGGADMVIEMDAGGSHDPALIPRFVESLSEVDCCFGSRYMGEGASKGQPFTRWFLSRSGTFLSRILLGLKLTDATGGFCAYRREALQSTHGKQLLSRGYFYQTEMKFRVRGFRCREIPLVYEFGSSHLRLASILEALRLLFRLFLEKTKEGRGRTLRERAPAGGAAAEFEF